MFHVSGLVILLNMEDASFVILKYIGMLPEIVRILLFDGNLIYFYVSAICYKEVRF